MASESSLTSHKGTQRFQYGDAIQGEQLRVLSLLPAATLNAHIECEMYTVLRDDNSRYEALSYCWGNEEPKTQITVNKLSLEIRENLAYALRYLRLEHDRRFLWCDAVCINQSPAVEFTEKNKQVGRMAETYRKASKVIVWLGEPSEDDRSTLAMKAIKSLGSQYQDQKLNKVHSQFLSLPPNIDGVGPQVYLPAIRKLLQREWFTRLWVIQEVCLAPADSVTLVCGHDEVDFWQFANLQLTMLGPRDLNPSVEEVEEVKASLGLFWARPPEPPLVLTRQLHAVSEEEVPGIEELRKTKGKLLMRLVHFRNRKCENPRDRIYALRSLACDVNPKSIEPNYGETVGQTYAKATRAIMEADKNFDVLFMCNGPEQAESEEKPPEVQSPEEPALGKRRRVTNLPSWVPNFDDNESDRPNISMTTYMPTGETHYKATNGSKAEFRISDDVTTLTLYGHEIGTIKAVAPFSPKTWHGSLLHARDLIEEHTSWVTRTSAERKETFWRTLVTNRTVLGTAARAEIEGTEFDVFWEFTKSPDSHTEADLLRFSNYNKAFFQHGFRRSFFITASGDIGLAPLTTKVEDVVCLLAGGQVPLVFRRKGEQYQVVGECYMYGSMDGEHWKALENCDTQRADFTLI